jgi:hypothetical protein
MKRYENGTALAKDMGIPAAKLEETFNKYNEICKNGGKGYEFLKRTCVFAYTYIVE